MIMAVPLKPAPNLGIVSVYRMKIHWAFAKLEYFFQFIDVWDSPLILTHAMASFSGKIYDELLTAFFVTQYMIKLIWGQIALGSVPLLEVSSDLEFYYLSNYYITLNVNTMS